MCDRGHHKREIEILLREEGHDETIDRRGRCAEEEHVDGRQDLAAARSSSWRTSSGLCSEPISRKGSFHKSPEDEHGGLDEIERQEINVVDDGREDAKAERAERELGRVLVISAESSSHRKKNQTFERRGVRRFSRNMEPSKKYVIYRTQQRE